MGSPTAASDPSASRGADVIVALAGRSVLTKSCCPVAVTMRARFPVTTAKFGKLSQKRLKRPAVFETARSLVRVDGSHLNSR